LNFYELMLKKTIIVGLLFLTAAICQGQNYGKVSGLVTTSGGETLPNAWVVIEGKTTGTTADKLGRYTITELPYGTYTVIASFVGYTAVSQTVTLNAPELNLDFELPENTQSLEEVVVVSNALEEKRKEGFAIEGISIEAIQNQSIELNKVLDQTAGIRVRQDGGLGSRVNYMVNGLGGRSIRFFLDGIPMDYFGSSYSVNTIPVSMIERVEVYKGVVPVELSNDALGGAINLVTKKKYANAAALSYSYGSFNTHRVSLQANYRNEKSGATFRLTSFYNYTDNNYRIWGDDIYVTDPSTFVVKRGIKVRRFHDAFESRAVKADIGFTQQKWADQLFLGMVYSDMDKDIQHGSTMEIPFGEATYHQTVAVPYLVYQKYDLLKGLDLNLFNSYSHLVREQVDTARTIYNWYGEVEGMRTLGGERSRSLNTLTEDVFLNRTNLVYHIHEQHKLGFNYLFSGLSRIDRDPLITDRSEGYWSPQRVKKHSLGLAWQSELAHQKINTSLFMKAFHNSAEIKTTTIEQGITHYNTEYASASSLGYGFAGSYLVTSYLLLSTSVEKTYRLPEADEILGDGLTIISTTKLRPESSYNTNLGFKFQFFEESKNTFRFYGNAFYRNVTDLIQQWQYDMGAFVYINFDNVQMKGFDGRIEYLHQSLFTLNQTFSYLNPIVKSDTDELGNNNITQEARLPNTPFLQMNTDARLTLKNLIQQKSETFLYWNVGHVGSFYKYSEIIGEFNKDKIPSQWVNSCGIGYTFPEKKCSLSLDVNNIFNEQVFDNYAIQKPGRAAFFKITYKII
jgi:outer membrane receptor protein involved in Fe transport